MRRQDSALTLAEADGVAITLAASTEDDRVAVEEELTGFTTWKFDLVLTAPAELKHRSVLRLLGSGDGACAKHVTDAHVATSDGVMGDGLLNRVVEVTHVAGGHDVRLGHSGRLDEHLEVDVVAAQVVVLEVRQHTWLLGRKGNLERSEGLGSDNPGGDGAGEVLGVEGSKRDVLPNLHVSGRPIVQDAVTEDMVAGLVDGDGVAHGVGLGDERAHLELKIHTVASRPGGDLLVGGDLALGAADLGTGDDDRGSSTVVTDGEMHPVRLDGVVGSTDHASDVVGVRVGRVEVGVVSDEDRHAHLDGTMGEHAGRLEGFSELGASLGKDSLEGSSDFEAGNLAQLHELVESGLAHDMDGTVAHERSIMEESLVFDDAEVNDLITDTGAAVNLVGGGVHKGAEGDVLKGELAVLGIFDPTTKGAV